MRRERVTLTYQLTFESGFHFGTGLRNGTIHRSIARDADGFLYVPGSTLKGVLRERCEQLATLFDIPVIVPHKEEWREANQKNADVVARIFGTRFRPGQLYFDDAKLDETQQTWFEPPHRAQDARQEYRPTYRAWQTEQRTQVSLSRATRTAESGRLFTSEYGRANLVFAGKITGILEGTELFECEVGTYPLLLLITSLLSLDRIGGSKSTGAGKVSCKAQEILIDGEPCELPVLLSDLPTLALYDEWRQEVNA